jgi:polysaccharide export outer membrane protein
MSMTRLKATLLILTLGTAGAGLLSRGFGGAPQGDGSSGAPTTATLPREVDDRGRPYVIEPPDVLDLQVRGTLPEAVRALAGQRLVRPDGTVGLGTYGSAHVAGLTTEQAADAIAARLKLAGAANGLTLRQLRRRLSVEVAVYNSKVCYVIVGGDQGEQVYRLPLTGSETVLDVLATLPDMVPRLGKSTIRLVRRGDQSLPVDWKGITRRGATTTNYIILSGDRIIITPEKGSRLNNPGSLRQGISYDRLFEGALGAVDDLFGGIAYANRYEGRIESDPTTAKEGDGRGTRRRSVVQISCPPEGGYQVEVKVFRERRVRGTEPGTAEISWQGDGRDEDLEQAILRRLTEMSKTDPGR